MDRYSVHRSAARQLSAEGRRWFSVEWLPAYSPELDPVEAVWSHTKCVDLANFIPNDIDDLYYAVVDSLNEQARDASLKISYFDWAGLKI